MHCGDFTGGGCCKPCCAERRSCRCAGAWWIKSCWRRIVQQPILKIDDPMMSEAARNGPRIGLLCTASSTVEPRSALLRAHAAQQGREITIKTVLRPEAYQALMAGDRARHDAILHQAATEISKEVDANCVLVGFHRRSTMHC
jgi:Asp/Glu/hydantoin racemase